MQQRHSQFTRHDPRETFRRTTNGHKMRYFQQFIPVEEKFLFPALSRIIKGSFHQLGSVADISAVGKFPGQLFWEVEVETGRWSPLVWHPPSPGSPGSDGVPGAQILFSHGPYKGSAVTRVVRRVCCHWQGQPGSYWEEV